MTDVDDPRGVVEVEAIPLAVRPDRIAGQRLGVRSNSKCNAAKVVRATVRELVTQGIDFATVNNHDKEHFSSAPTLPDAYTNGQLPDGFPAAAHSVEDR
jgi:hypothetical protein